MSDVQFLPPQRPKLFIALPGQNFDFQWVAPFLDLFSFLLQNFEISWGHSQSCNIFSVRNGLVDHINRFNPDFVLWIDSDNQVSTHGFKLLYQKLSDYPEMSAIGGWYVINKAGVNAIAAGWDGTQEACKLDEFQKKDPFEVEYIGFGFLLMRYEIIKKLSEARKEVFRPRLDEKRDVYHGDDVGFCLDAKDLGFNFYLHPQVYSPHLKMRPIEIVQDK